MFSQVVYALSRYAVKLHGTDKVHLLSPLSWRRCFRPRSLELCFLHELRGTCVALLGTTGRARASSCSTQKPACTVSEALIGTRTTIQDVLVKRMVSRNS